MTPERLAAAEKAAAEEEAAREASSPVTGRRFART